MSHSHNTGVGNHKEHCKRYYDQGRLEKNRQRKAMKYQKFLKWCKAKWLKGKRVLRGTKRRVLRGTKRRVT